MSALYAAAESGNNDTFKEELDKVITEGILPFDVSPLVGLLVRNDNGVMMKALLDAEITIKEKLRESSSFAKQWATGDLKIVSRIEHEEKEATRNPEINFGHVLNYAGIGQDHEHVIKPNIMFAAVQSEQFREAITNQSSAVSDALGNLMLRKGDQTRRIVPILKAIEAAGPEKTAYFARETMLASLHDDTNCFNTGERGSFELIAEKLDQQGVDAVFKRVVKKQNGTGEEYDARLKLIMDRASAQALEEMHKSAAATGSAGMYETLSQRVAIDPKEDLLAACGNDTGEMEREKATARSLQNLEKILGKHEFDADAIFAAIVTAIDAKKDGHLIKLLDYARETLHEDTGKESPEDDKFKQMMARPTPRGNTLLVAALMVKNGKRYDPNDNPVVDRMAIHLIKAGASTLPDSHGNHPLTLLQERGMQGGATHTSINSIVVNEVGLIYEEKKLALGLKYKAQEMREKIAMLKELKEAGLSNAEAIAFLNPPSEPAAPQPQQSLPNLGPYSGKIVAEKEKLGGGDLPAQGG